MSDEETAKTGSDPVDREDRSVMVVSTTWNSSGAELEGHGASRGADALRGADGRRADDPRVIEVYLGRDSAKGHA
jgi:hypothetical protein